MLIMILFLAVLAIGAVSAAETNITDDVLNIEYCQNNMIQDNLAQVNESDALQKDSQDEKLEETYYYDAEDGKSYEDDTVVTHDVVKYYGDKSTRFFMKVYDNDYNPQGDVDVEFGEWGMKKTVRTTNNNGLVSFPINYAVGKHVVISYIMCEDDESYFTTNNLVIIKSTIPTKQVSKYVTEKNKKFSIKFLNSKGKALSNRLVKIKVRDKVYKIRTDSKGIAKIKINSFKVGKHSIIATNPSTKEKRKITVKIYEKSNYYTATMTIKSTNYYFTTKKLKTGDNVDAFYEYRYGKQASPGIYIGTKLHPGHEAQHSTRLIKAKVYFKDDYTGRIVTKTGKPASGGYNIKTLAWVDGLTPYKVKIWYKHR